MSGNFVQNNCRIVVTNISGTSATTIHTATGYTHAIGIRLGNRTGSDVTATLTLFRSSATYTLLFQHIVPANGQVWLPLEAFGLDVGDEFRVTQGTASGLTAFVSIAEVPGRSG